MGSDTNLIVTGKSGNVYTFYLRSEPSNASEITYSQVDVVLDGGARLPMAGAATASSGGAMNSIFKNTNTKSTSIGVDGEDYDWIKTMKIDPSEFRFDLDIFVPNPDDYVIAPERVWRDRVFTYIDFGDKVISMTQRPVVSLLVEGCRFEGCNTAMNFGSTTADTVITVTNCQFVSNYAKSSTAAGITFGTGEGLLNVLGCAFERGWLASNQLALDLSLAGKRTVVRNCTFSDGWCLGDFNAASILVRANGITVDIERCTFTGIRSRITGNSYASAACIKDQAALSSSSVIVRDTAFIGNVMETAGTLDSNYRCFGSVYGGQSGSEHQFVNCLFASNVLYHGATRMGYPGTIQGGYDGGNFLVVNCLFKDNDVFRIVTAEDGAATTNRLPEIDIGRVDTRPRRVMNTIMMNSAADYKPFNSNPPGLKSMCIPGYTGFPAGDKTLLTCDPLLLDGPTERNGVTAWGLKCGSPCRKVGFPCWAGTNRRFYRYDPAGNAEKPWVSLLQGERLTDVEAADVGVSLAAAPLPDAFGEARNPNRVALGQLNAPVSGLMMLVR